MNFLPNNDRAILDIRKIEDYCLNPAHPRGRHKAQVFRRALGIERADAACCEGFYLMRCATAKRSNLPVTSLEPAGASTFLSHDTTSALW
jgi:hypothetical protein